MNDSDYRDNERMREAIDYFTRNLDALYQLRQMEDEAEAEMKQKIESQQTKRPSCANS